MNKQYFLLSSGASQRSGKPSLSFAEGSVDQAKVNLTDLRLIRGLASQLHLIIADRPEGSDDSVESLGIQVW